MPKRFVEFSLDAFYAQEAASQGLSVRGLRHLNSRKAFERREIAW
ncbi:MAG TPA: hypothetical protein VK053_17445 [Jiangellaceae bacterium]|nr:hypothetical protein [Jiangellaceae bacterium]